MSATPALVHNKPITTLHASKIKTPKIPTSGLYFSGESLIPRIIYSKTRSWGSKPMDNSIKISAFGGYSDSVDDEIEIGCLERGSLEQEVLVPGSSQIPSNSALSRFESTLNSMSKWLATAVFIALVFIRHDSEVLWGAMGSVINVLISNLLKKIINQERPDSSLKPDPGMPSSHAQSLFFIFLFAIISMIEYFGINGLTIALSGLALVIPLYLSWLRVAQKFHTISQIAVGATMGSIFCIFWFWAWDAFVREFFVSHLWVRILVLLGAVGFGIGFIIHVIQHWIMVH